MMGFGLAMGGFGIIFMLLFWIGLIVLAVWVVSLLFPSTKESRHQDSGSKPGSAREILRARYAQGDLTAEQYQDMLAAIQP
jgi:uncharacterized membrane protein